MSGRPTSHTGGFRVRALRRTTAAASIGLLASCGTGPESAPAWGTLGGIALGAGIGSLSGDAGTGAVIGAMAGNSTGELVRASSHVRTAPPPAKPADLSGTLRRASEKNAELQREFGALARDFSRAKASGDPQRQLVVRSQAADRKNEAGAWHREMGRQKSSLDRILRGGAPPAGRGYSRVSSDRETADRLARAFKEQEKRFRGLARAK